ncbi:MAG: hypothetical protein ACREBJ_02305 [Nitrosotalea sp.]
MTTASQVSLTPITAGSLIAMAISLGDFLTASTVFVDATGYVINAVQNGAKVFYSLCLNNNAGAITTIQFVGVTSGHVYDTKTYTSANVVGNVFGSFVTNQAQENIKIQIKSSSGAQSAIICSSSGNGFSNVVSDSNPNPSAAMQTAGVIPNTILTSDIPINATVTSFAVYYSRIKDTVTPLIINGFAIVPYTITTITLPSAMTLKVLKIICDHSKLDQMLVDITGNAVSLA